MQLSGNGGSGKRTVPSLCFLQAHRAVISRFLCSWEAFVFLSYLRPFVCVSRWFLLGLVCLFAWDLLLFPVELFGLVCGLVGWVFAVCFGLVCFFFQGSGLPEPFLLRLHRQRSQLGSGLGNAHSRNCFNAKERTSKNLLQSTEK